MAFPIIVKEEAATDALEAYLYYEAQVTGLGDKFLQALVTCYDRIKTNPQYYSFISSKKARTLRDLQIDGFPYVVISDFDGERIIVYAVHNNYRQSKFH